MEQEILRIRQQERTNFRFFRLSNMDGMADICQRILRIIYRPFGDTGKPMGFLLTITVIT